MAGAGRGGPVTRARREVYTVRTSTGTYQYRGDPTGPANARSLRLNGGRWRRGTMYEWKCIRVHDFDRVYPLGRATSLQEGK